MIEYSVYPGYSVEHYKKACKFVEDLLRDEIVNQKSLIDVDGSQLQFYNTSQGEILVINDFDYDWVIVQSEFEINNTEWYLRKQTP